MIPLGDSTRRQIHFSVMTLTIIGVNAFVFILELLGDEAFILRWAFVPADLMTPHGFLPHHLDNRSTQLNQWQGQFWSVTLADRRFAQALAGSQHNSSS